MPPKTRAMILRSAPPAANNIYDRVRQSRSRPVHNSAASSTVSRTRQSSGAGQGSDILRNLLNVKNLRKRSSLMTILLLLFGGGSMLTAFFSPSLAIVQKMKEVFTKGLNDQLRAVDERSSVLIRSKLKDVTKGSCGAVKIKCRYATMTEKQIKKYERNNSGLKFNTVPLERRVEVKVDYSKIAIKLTVFHLLTKSEKQLISKIPVSSKKN